MELLNEGKLSTNDSRESNQEACSEVSIVDQRTEIINNFFLGSTIKESEGFVFLQFFTTLKQHFIKKYLL